jgi:formylglycine-generating enzyme required for sulfatase activity
MVTLPGSAFEMGSGADQTERPMHRVAIASFAIGKFEVTRAEWAACATEKACSYAPPPGAGDDRQPMANLSWDDAVEYARWLARSTGRPYRLPSEAEWEFAARAGTTTPYPWGTHIGVAKANCGGCGGAYEPSRPAAVGSFPANPWGLHDMLGGVAEWVEDCWHKSYEGAPRDGSAWATANCGQRVLRGGSWRNPPNDLTVSARNFYDASVRYSAHGVRVALSLNKDR